MITRVDAVAFMLATGVSVRLSAFGRSMHPAIRSGESIVVEPVGQRRLGLGHVVLIRQGCQLVAHRIVREAPGPRFLVAGDSSSGHDGWVRPEAVLGCVVGVMRGTECVPVLGRSFARRFRQLLSRARAASRCRMRGPRQRHAL